MNKITVVIPARMASTRLPNKPMADICGTPMIEHVWRRAVEANIGEVFVSCAEQEIADAIHKVGGTAIITSPDLPSGSDRVLEGLKKLGQAPEKSILTVESEIVVNLQGDLPTIEPFMIKLVADKLEESGCDIATLAAPIKSAEEAENPNVVKVAFAGDAPPGGKALYFSRSCIPYGTGLCWHHIGIYAYRYGKLAKFLDTPPSPLERREKLEQLRALEAGMSIYVATVDTIPLGVDTEEDLQRARKIIGEKT